MSCVRCERRPWLRSRPWFVGRLAAGNAIGLPDRPQEGVHSRSSGPAVAEWLVSFL